MIHPLIQYIPAILILLYIPFVCISDWRTRTFNPFYYIPAVLVNIPLLYLYLVESPLRNYYLMGLTIMLCLLVFAIALTGIIGGGDFWFISLIMLTVPYNPFLEVRRFFPLDFLYTTLLVGIYVPLIVYLYHFYKKDRLPIWKMLTVLSKEFPYMIPISFAFILTLAMEMVVFR